MGRGNLVISTCPICGDAVNRTVAKLDSHPLYRCGVCAHFWIRLLDERQLAEMYGHSYSGFQTDHRFGQMARTLFVREFGNRISPPARVLDVGCGNGQFLEIATGLGHQAYGLDASASAVEMCLQAGLQAYTEDFLEHWPAEKPNIVTFWDVLEHVANPVQFLKHARELTAPHGFVLAKVPLSTRRSVAASALSAPIARSVLMVPSHVQFFSPRSLKRGLQRAGFRTPDVRPHEPMRSMRRDGGALRNLKRHVRHHLATSLGTQNLLAIVSSG